MPEADKAELESLDSVFCKDRRNKELLVGSVMSNIGYGEAASGISAVTKVVFDQYFVFSILFGTIDSGMEHLTPLALLMTIDVIQRFKRRGVKIKYVKIRKLHNFMKL